MYGLHSTFCVETSSRNRVREETQEGAIDRGQSLAGAVDAASSNSANCARDLQTKRSTAIATSNYSNSSSLQLLQLVHHNAPTKVNDARLLPYLARNGSQPASPLLAACLQISITTSHLRQTCLPCSSRASQWPQRLSRSPFGREENSK